MPTMVSLPPEYMVRAPVREDISAIIALIYAHDVAETGEGDMMEEGEILFDWKSLDLAKDAWVVVSKNGDVCGYATLSIEHASGRLIADGYVHPEHYGRGIGSSLVALMETRAQEMVLTLPDDIRLVLVNNVIANNEAPARLLEASGYTLARVFFRMAIDMQDPPALQAFPEGINVRVSDGSTEDIRQAYETVEESFRDHWGHAPRSFDEWHGRRVDETFDPALWFLAEEGKKVVGVALCRRREDGSGWISQLAVLRPWRKHGLGTALLKQAFHTFYRQGIRRVGLGVDGQSLTGAQRLYERAGMLVNMRIGRYEKELRAGRDLLEESQRVI